MKLCLLLTCAAALFTTRVAAAAAFEGKVETTISTEGRPSQTMTYLIRPGQLRSDITTGKAGTAIVIVDFNKQELTMIMPAQEMYLTRPLNSAALTARANQVADQSTAAPMPRIENAGASEKILGYDCTKYVSHSPRDGTVFEVWATDQLGAFSGLGGELAALRQGRASAAGGNVLQSWEQAIMGKGFFPLRVVGRDAAGNEKFRMDVVAIEKESLPASDFLPPAGFHELNFGNATAAGGAQP